MQHETNRLDADVSKRSFARTRFQQIDPHVAADFDAAMRDNKFFRALGAQRHREVVREWTEERKAQRRPHLDVVKWVLGRRLMDITPKVATFKAQAEEPPTIEQAYIKHFNQLGVTPLEILQIAQIEMVGRLALLPELRDCTPAERLRQYQQALTAPGLPTNALRIQLTESLVRGHEVRAANDGELADARALVQLIEQTRSSRLPAELGEIDLVIAEAEHEYAACERLGIVGRNPRHDPRAQAAYEEEEARIQAELAQWQPVGA